MEHELHKKLYIDPGSSGRPSWYPSPPADDDLLFFIQRNQNADTIVYRVNRTIDGFIQEHIPMEAYWIRYTAGGVRCELSEIQNKLAYGYESTSISRELYKFQFVSYKEMTFYISRIEGSDLYRTLYQYDGQTIKLDNIYVYADELGVFPVVKYIELFGRSVDSGESHYRLSLIHI